MAFFNDPIDTPDHAHKAVRMALECREVMELVSRKWTTQGVELNYGAGIASGHATIGGIGGDGCWDYSVIGTVSNLASRLCSQAKNGQILVPPKFLSLLQGAVSTESVGTIELKGIMRPVQAHNILKLS